MKVARGKYIAEVIFLMILCLFIDNISSSSDNVLDTIISMSYKFVIIILLFRLYKKVRQQNKEREKE
ncbi:hypothetical protein [Priestia taiwanensis]|uniref:Uncharacterized protein n=1 Tax=Priestia taiwanensis TaxID=1347902 RepID=A0A917ER09_9BACI|nr:hypothetical protein [Priestia taiwanensis]MBM7363187.1 low temperature requirement protein LtrA [Priestia taiwanensis]GGE68355.1 hypothetical protein GCM10007140_18060 [Priestia taiwanensis]